MTRRVLVATAFCIPHSGGASTHIEQLHAVLCGRHISGGLLAGQHVKGPSHARLANLVHRLLSRDQSRVSLLNKTVERFGERIERTIPATSQEEWIVHTHDPLATCGALRSGRRGSAVVQTVHGPWSRENVSTNDGKMTKFHRAILAFEREAFTGADLLLPVDSGQGAILREEFAVEPERIRVIPNAVDISALAAVQPNMAAKHLPQRFFLVPRRLVPKNGVEFAIRAFARMADRPSDLRLVIAGDGPSRPDLERLVAREGLSREILFTGNVGRGALMGILKRSLGVLVPSVPSCGVIEATSYSVLEAMACGVPVIASAIGGISEILISAEMGFRVRPAEPDDIASAMGQILGLSPDTRDRIIRVARARVLDEFGLEVWFSKIGAAYDEAARRRSMQRGLPGSDGDIVCVAHPMEPR